MLIWLEAEKVGHDVKLRPEIFDVAEQHDQDGYGQDILDIVEFCIVSQLYLPCRWSSRTPGF